MVILLRDRGCFRVYWGLAFHPGCREGCGQPAETDTTNEQGGNHEQEQSRKTTVCDVLVIGSGVAGMAAALKAASQGLTVIVAEKEQHFGGTTAISAGWAWVPGNRQGVAQGDTREEAETYLKHLAPETFNEAGVRDFLDTVPEAVSFSRTKPR